MTKQRQLILDIIFDTMEHLTAEEIFVEAKKRVDRIAFATVYNNLNSLVDEGKLKRIKVAGVPDHFEKNPIFHEHLICDCCGRVVDAFVPNMKEELEQMLNVKLTKFNLDMHYICDHCEKESAQ